MKDYLKQFDTTAEYNTYINGTPDLPNVSLTLDDNEVHYNKYVDYSREYLTFEALESGTFTLTVPTSVTSSYMTSVSYSTDDGANWVTTMIDNTAQTITTPTINAGDKVLWKGIGINASNNSYYSYSIFSSTGDFNVSGNIMSFFYGDNFVGQTDFPSRNQGYFFYRMFYGCIDLISAANLILPATTLATYCYSGMFQGCTSLTTAPELPATTLSVRCYQEMFQGCTSLTTAPELPATTLAQTCYFSMFKGCTSLTTAPELPATTLASGCYSSMFSGCTAITSVPSNYLPVTTLAQSCYSGMFKDCRALTTAPELPATTLADYCYREMLKNTRITTLPELPATTLAQSCYREMFTGCTAITSVPSNYLPVTTLANSCYYSMFQDCRALTTAPELPATTLTSECYSSMFNGCTSLTTAPELPATTLANYCYQSMFYGCRNINSITMLATDISATNCLFNWVNGVAATGTFTKAASATIPTGLNGIPSGWTVVDA